MPRISAARANVFNVTDSFSGSSRRSSWARLGDPLLLHRLGELPGKRLLCRFRSGFFENSLFVEKLIEGQSSKTLSWPLGASPEPGKSTLGPERVSGEGRRPNPKP